MLALLLSAVPLAVQEAAPAPPELTPRTFRHAAGEYHGVVGRLRVPENRAKPDSKTIELAFARLTSTAKEPRATVVYLAGGPGDSATSAVEDSLWEGLLTCADVILLDQRGVGRSKPELVFTPEFARPDGVFLDATASLDASVAMAEEAKASCDERGVDLTGYTTVESAADVDALRAALGLEKIVLLGFSYGTHLAQEIVRRFPERVEGVVLVGTAGMNDMHKLPSELDAHWRMLSGLVARDERIGKAIPDLDGLLRRTLAKLAAEPLTVTVPDPDAGGTRELLFGPAGLQLVLLRDMGDTQDLPVLPRLLHEVERGETGTLRWFLEKRLAQMRSVGVMTLVMRGASGATRERWERIEREAATSPFGKARVMPPPEVSAVLGTPDLGDAFRAPVKSSVRALFVSGTLDGNTPPAQAELVRAGFSRSAHLIVENAGHEDLLPDPEVRAAIVRFLGGELRDARLVRPPLRFAPLEGPSDVRHPSLEGR
jgi:pimeloyl-ACP methyl ester carboxylesterase